MHRTPVGGKNPLSQTLLRRCSALDALFAFFNKNPKSVDTSSTDSLLIGPAALAALSRTISVLREPRLNGVMEATKEKLCDHATKIAIWMELSVYFSHLANQEDILLDEMLRGISSAMWMCLSLGGGVVDALTAKRQIIKALLKLWSSHHTGRPGAMVNGADHKGNSTITSFVLAFVSTESGRQSLLDTFFSSPRILKTFCKATSARITHIPEYTNFDDLAFNVHHARKVLYDYIKDVIAALARHPPIFKALCDADYLRCWSRTLVKLAPFLTPDDVFQKGKDIFMQCLAMGGNPLSNYLSVLDGGLFEVLVPNLARRSLEDLHSKEGFVRNLARFETYLVYPHMIKSLSESKDRIDSLIAENWSNFFESTLGYFWASMLNKHQTFEENLKNMNEEVYYPICDNETQVRKSISAECTTVC
ncbi:hypothetical protein BKA70DRAFT_1446544 [Coprinopsis sp. MPI-PUGE-AT-0042]|nr:hypothetical protein BKA70DRAFT_1446544 [Coprinopsis sp. MPI-PUGE-AT-0042]